jgi:hypothetical protein
MATIHSLPTELIRHTLRLTYPPGRKGSGRGLCSTALVHSSWTKPSQSVMIERIRLDGDDRASLDKFLERGPDEFRCRGIELWRCSDEIIQAVLAKARAGGIHSLRLVPLYKTLVPRMFASPSLNGQSSG